MKKFLLGILALSILCTACKKDKEEASLDKSQLIGRWKVTNVTSAITVMGNPEQAAGLNSMFGEEFYKKDDVFNFQANDTLKIEIGYGDYETYNYRVQGVHVIVVDPEESKDLFKLAGNISGSTLTFTMGKEELKFVFQTNAEGFGLDSTALNLLLSVLDGKVELTLSKQ